MIYLSVSENGIPTQKHPKIAIWIGNMMDKPLIYGYSICLLMYIINRKVFMYIINRKGH